MLKYYRSVFWLFSPFSFFTIHFPSAYSHQLEAEHSQGLLYTGDRSLLQLPQRGRGFLKTQHPEVTNPTSPDFSVSWIQYSPKYDRFCIFIQMGKSRKIRVISVCAQPPLSVWTFASEVVHNHSYRLWTFSAVLVHTAGGGCTQVVGRSCFRGLWGDDENV